MLDYWFKIEIFVLFTDENRRALIALREKEREKNHNNRKQFTHIKFNDWSTSDCPCEKVYHGELKFIRYNNL